MFSCIFVLHYHKLLDFMARAQILPPRRKPWARENSGSDMRHQPIWRFHRHIACTPPSLGCGRSWKRRRRPRQRRGRRSRHDRDDEGNYLFSFDITWWLSMIDQISIKNVLITIRKRTYESTWKAQWPCLRHELGCPCRASSREVRYAHLVIKNDFGNNFIINTEKLDSKLFLT